MRHGGRSTARGPVGYYLVSAAGLLVAVWRHARVTANARIAITSAPITSMYGWSAVRLGRGPPVPWIAAVRCTIGRSYMACSAGDPASMGCGICGIPQLG